jgi:DNA repair protein RadC
MRQFVTRPSATLYFWEHSSMQFKLSDLNRSIVKVQLLQDVSSTSYDYKITNASDVDKLVGAELRKLDREYLLAIYLTSRNKVIDIEVVAIGCLTQVPVHPREVIKSAILANAHSFILVHNHPSGDHQPTKEDHRITEEMIEAGRLMQIPLKDHVIIGKDWFSLFERECIGQG